MDLVNHLKYLFQNKVKHVIILFSLTLFGCEKECPIKEEPNCITMRQNILGSWSAIIFTETFMNNISLSIEKKYVPITFQDTILTYNRNETFKWQFKCNEQTSFITIHGIIRDSITDYQINELSKDKMVFSGHEYGFPVFPKDTYNYYSTYYLIKQ